MRSFFVDSEDKWIKETLEGLRRLAEIKRQADAWAYSEMLRDAPPHMCAAIKKWRAAPRNWRDFVEQPVFDDLEAMAQARGIAVNYQCVLNEEVDLSSRGPLERQLVGALRDGINAHGPITRENANSAAKRLIGAIKTYNRRVKNGELR